MHELSMCEAIARKVIERAADRQVTTVVVQIGHLRQVVPEAMTFSWEMLTAATVLEGAELQIDHVPATVECATCAAVTTLEAPVLECGSCRSRNVTVRTGEELLLVSLELAGETVAAADGRH